ncbi:hypothetical protein BDFB_000555 [Asbolus verrucosus]|uniref:MFS 1 domain containing protein n=1 Tax=Asbolus verrucosus TaxID=1661398 RepID=A0A482W8C6_ASBVE|nr:hypothetical protein BDFB_000555 [Asbolus verrucosus]
MHERPRHSPGTENFTRRQKIGLVIITVIDLMSFCSISLMSLFLPKEAAEKGAYLQIYDFSLKFSVFITIICSLFFGVIGLFETVVEIGTTIGPAVGGLFFTMGGEKGFENTVTTHSYVISTWTFMFSIGEILGPSMGLTLYKKYSFAVVSLVISTINILMAFVCTIFLYCKAKNRNICCTFNVTIYF